MPDYRLGKLKGRWVCVWYDETGRRHRHRLDAGTPSEARAAFREFTRKCDAIARPAERLTVEDLWADYVAEKEAQEKVSVQRMKDAWKALKETFAAVRPSDVTPILVREYTARRRQKVGDGTVHTELGYLRAALRSGGAPVSVELPSKPRPRSRHLSPEEARRFLDAAVMPHVRLFILLALHTAGRPSSILDLTWDRVGIDTGRISLDNPSRDRTSKGRATVPMARELVGVLQEAREEALTENVIEWAGKPVKSIKKAIKRTSERAGLEGVTPYVLRHTAAVWLAEGGVPMEEIAQYMGHTSPAVTFRTYARYSPEYQRKASDVISTVLHGCAEPATGNAK